MSQDRLALRGPGSTVPGLGESMGAKVTLGSVIGEAGERWSGVYLQDPGRPWWGLDPSIQGAP